MFSIRKFVAHATFTADNPFTPSSSTSSGVCADENASPCGHRFNPPEKTKPTNRTCEALNLNTPPAGAIDGDSPGTATNVTHEPAHTDRREIGSTVAFTPDPTAASPESENVPDNNPHVCPGAATT
jgi:hypothetical protein